jgi:hypothetical protein
VFVVEEVCVEKRATQFFHDPIVLRRRSTRVAAHREKQERQAAHDPYEPEGKARY